MVGLSSQNAVPNKWFVQTTAYQPVSLILLSRPPRSYRQELQELGFLDTSLLLLKEWNELDILLHTWGRSLLR